MTTPLSDTRLTEIRERAAHLYEYCQQPVDADVLAGTDVPDLLAEIDRLRAENERLAEDAARDVARERERAGRCERDAVEARAELAIEQAKVRGAETVKCWTNEDGRRFVFAEDLAFALGYTPTALKES